ADCPGSTVPITINGPGIVVRLRNMTLDGGGLGGAGVDAKNLASLSLENCVITNSNNGNQNASAPYVGVMFEPSASADLFISNSIIGNNGAASSSGSGGVDIVPAAGATVQVVIDHSQINRNYFGVVGDGRNGGIIRATISDSVIAGNLSNGVTAISTSS